MMKPCPGIPFQHYKNFHVSLKHQSIHICLILLFILFIGLAFVKYIDLDLHIDSVSYSLI